MNNFAPFGNKLYDHFTVMSTTDLFVSSIDSELLWETYLQSFPEGNGSSF